MKFHRISSKIVDMLGHRAILPPDDIEQNGRMYLVKIKYSYDGHESIIHHTYGDELSSNLLMIVTTTPTAIRHRKYNNLKLCSWIAVDDGNYCFWATYPTESHFQHRWEIKRVYKHRRVLIEKTGN